jgi:hypothetical protein
MAHPPDPVLINARREAWIIFGAWLTCTIYCCTYYYLFGLSRPGNPLGPEDVRPVLGMPSWVFWGIFAPWVAFFVFNIVFAGFYMKDDPLGADHTQELERDIREGAGQE